MLKKTLLFSALFTSTLLFAQNYAKLYPNEDVLTLSLTKHIKIDTKKGKLNITEEVTKKNLFLTNNSLSMANESVSYNTFNTIKSIKASTFNPEEGKYNYVQRFTSKDVVINGIFFNDQKEKSFVFPNVKKGATTHLNYIKQVNDPHFIPAFIIGSNTPIINGQYSVSFPKNVEVAFKTFHLDSTKTTFKVIEDTKNTTYVWHIKDTPKINRHYDFSPLYYIPQIIIHIKSYSHKETVTNVLSQPKDLYRWYTSLIEKNNYSNNDLKKITLDLIKNDNTDREKIERIYYFVQNNINYIAFEDGLNGFIPRDAFQVYLKKYGDCKDMANILNEMLHYAGIDSRLTWIGTRRKPYSYYDVPTPIADNHMITAVNSNGKYTFLDATAKYLTYGLPSPFTQGKEALISKGKFDFEIVKVPEVDANLNVTKIVSEMEIETAHLALKGTHKATLSGYEKLEYLHKLERKDDKNFSFLYFTLKFGTKQTAFNTIEHKNLNIAQQQLDITFNTETKDYVKKIGNEIYVKPNFDYNLKKEAVKHESKAFDKKIDYKLNKIFQTILHIPEGYTLDALPKNVSLENDAFDLRINYKLLENKAAIAIDKTLSIKSLRIFPNQIEAWNAFIKLLNKSNKQSLIFKKTI